MSITMTLGPLTTTYYWCPDCESYIDEEECFETVHPSGDVELAHHGDEKTLGGDGYGDHCAGEMDFPATHWLEVDE